MAAMQTTIIVLFALSVKTILSNDIFCPDSANDKISYTQNHDYGLNIYARTTVGSLYKEDCYLRYGNYHNPTAATIINDFIDLSQDLVVFIHGWQPEPKYFDGTHKTSDQWNLIALDSCNGKDILKGWITNLGTNNPEPCPPTDHNAQYWIKNG
eukprot:372800_1